MGLLALVGLALATRVQAVAFVPAILAAPFLLALLGRRPLRATLAPFRVLYGVVIGGGLLVLGLQVARGRSLSELLGAYAVVGDSSYDPATVARFLLYHLAELDLYLGVLPMAAFFLLVLLSRRLEPSLAPFLAAGIAVTGSVLLVVATFASEFANRIQERNMFAVAPFFLTALLVWVERGAPRPRVLATVAAVGAALLPLTIPFVRFIETGVTSDTLALLPIWSAYGSLLFDSIDATVLAGGALAAALFLFVPRRFVLVVPARHAPLSRRASPTTSGSASTASSRRCRGRSSRASRPATATGSTLRCPTARRSAILWTGVPDRFVVNQNEFFNRSVGPIYFVGGPTPGNLAETEVTVDEETGAVLRADGTPLEEEYVLVDATISPDAEAVARDPALGMTLWRLDGPLVSSPIEITGLYPNDSWSGPTVTWERQNCRGGTLTVGTFSDPSLFSEPQTITARVRGEVADRIRLNPTGNAYLSVPLEPEGGTCRVVFDVTPTAVPAEVTNGESTDERELGAHFFDFFHTR